MHPDDEVLAAIALGDDVAAHDAEHAMVCAVCRAVVADLSETLTALKASAGTESAQPPASLWARISDEVASDEALADPFGPTRRTAQPERRRPRVGWLVGAAAAGAALGVLGGQVAAYVTAPVSEVVARARLDTLDTVEQRGEATLLRGRDGYALQLGVQGMDAGDDLLEVWLINTDGTRMVSVGILPNTATDGSFSVNSGLFEQGYRIVDISREPLDDRPQHSGNSLLRGELA